MSEQTYSIYLIQNEVNGKVYIGKTKHAAKVRFSQHRWARKTGQCKHLYYAFNKHGLDSFSLHLIDTCTSGVKASELEKVYISLFRATEQDYGYNITPGGDGVPHTQESREKISAAMLAKWQKPEFREKLVQGAIQRWQDPVFKAKHAYPTGVDHPNYGKPMSEEQRKKISNSRIGKYCGRENPHYGKTHKTETKKLMSEIKKVQYIGKGNPFFGKKHSLDTKKRRYEKHFGKPYIEDKEIQSVFQSFKSHSEASKFLGCSVKHLNYRYSELGLKKNA